MNPDLREKLIEELRHLPKAVQAHVEQVRLVSLDVAQRHSLDVERAELAALAHDICRVTPAGDLLNMARGFGMPVNPIDEALPVFLHGPVGAEVLRRDYGVDDPEVLDPIRCHTMGREGMTPLDKLLFLADKLDPGKVKRYPFIEEVRRLAREDLDSAFLCFVDHQVRAFLDHGDLVHPGMMAARNEALMALKRRR